VQRREGEHVADVVEPVAGVVRRERGVGVEVHAEQVADGVAVLDPVEPAERHPAGVGVRQVDLERRPLDPLFEVRQLLGGRPRLALRRHHAGPQHLECPEPQFRVAGEVVPVERDLALALGAGVAADAERVENRLDVLAEGLVRPGGRSRAARGDDRAGGREEAEAGEPPAVVRRTRQSRHGSPGRSIGRGFGAGRPASHAGRAAPTAGLK